MIVKKDGDLCGCGQHGCIESIISGKNIARRAIEAGLVYNGQIDYTSKEVFDAYREGDPIAQLIIDETVEYMGILFIDIINITDTQCIVVGGSVFLNNMDVLLPAIQNYITEHSIVVLSEGVQFKPSELGEYVGDMAGLCLVIPPDVIDGWKESKPWTIGIKKVLKITIKETQTFKP